MLQLSSSLARTWQFAKELNQLKLDDLHLNGFLSFTPANNSHWQFICMPCQINFETVAVLMRNLHSPVCPDLVPDVNGRPLQRGSLHQAVLSAFDQSNWANLVRVVFISNSAMMKGLTAMHRRLNVTFGMTACHLHESARSYRPIILAKD